MTRISRLSFYTKSDVRQLITILKEFILVYRDNKVSLNYQSRPVVLFCTTVIGTFGIGTLFTIKSLLHQLNEYRTRRGLERPILTRQSSLILKNGSRQIFIPKGKNSTARVVIPKSSLDRYAADKYLYKNFHLEQRVKSQRNLLNSKFINQIVILWRILIPRVYSKNSSLLLTQCLFLILRTWLSLIIAKLDGQIVKNLISANGKKFARDLIYWILIAFPASYTNAAIKYLTNRLSLGFRTNLIRYIHDMYLDRVMTYYKISLNSDDIENIDQYI
ncbi:hypothetical protein OXX69_007937, partial [Metschnikowia pulcherrima]